MSSLNEPSDNRTTALPAPQEVATTLFANSKILAPMVRASTTPLRVLALSYGASVVFTEELIDRSILETTRVVNTELHTIDYVKPISSFPAKVQKRMVADKDNPDAKRGVVVLRIDPKVEDGKLIYQIGTGEAGLAVQAVERIVSDVVGVDVNMGCPKKFSVSGGMGSALLSDPKRACDIISTLRRNITKPVSAKIRLLHPTDPRPTLDFVRSLIQSGANAISIHGRIVGDESHTDARWDTLVEVVKILKETESVPINVNGDLYTHADMIEMRRRSGCDGIMLARPALYNMSLFRTHDSLCGNIAEESVDAPVEIPLSQFQTTFHSGHHGYNSPLLVPRTQIIQEYISQCVRYHNHSKNSKYVICEMMNARRHPTNRAPFLNMSLAKTVNEVCKCRSLNELVKIWDVKNTIPSLEEVAGMTDPHNYSDDYFLNPIRFQQERAAAAAGRSSSSGKSEDHKKSEDGVQSIPVAKRQKL